MALGRSHDFINLLLLPPFLYFVPREHFFTFGAGYLIGTFFLSPDLDLRHSKPSKRWKALRVVWKPYQKLSRHRGISHLPLLGSLTRLGYLLFLSVLAYFSLLGFSHLYLPELKKVLLSFDPFELISSLASKEWVFFFMLGIFASELCHIGLDLISSFFKRLLK